MAEPRSIGASAAEASPEQRFICRVCQKQFSQYTCPRCNVRYCSLPCYKKHSLRCTESFMRDNVMEEFRQMEPANQTKQKMLGILKRFHSENEDGTSEIEESDEDDFPLSAETIQKVAEGYDISLDDLSASERKEFLRAVASGKISHMVIPWEPWWLKPSASTISLSSQGCQLVQSLDISEDQMSRDLCPGVANLDENGLSDIPAGPENPLSSVGKLTKTEPSPLLAVHMVDVIYSYCFTLRFFNGDWKSDPLDAAMVCLSLSAVLSQVALPETVSEVLSKCLETSCSASFKHAGGLRFGICLFDDVHALLRLGRAALVCALMDLYRFLEAAAKEVKGERSKKREHSSKQMIANEKAKRQEIRNDESRKSLQSASKKVYFLMCWTNEQPKEVWTSLAALVEVEKNTLPARDSGDIAENTLNVNRQENQKPKVMIEEVL